jgi:hypothetical protein
MQFNYIHSPSLLPWFLNDYCKSQIKWHYEGIYKKEEEIYHSYVVKYNNDTLHYVHLFINKDDIEIFLMPKIDISVSCMPAKVYKQNDQVFFYQVMDSILSAVSQLYENIGLPIIK